MRPVVIGAVGLLTAATLAACTGGGAEPMASSATTTPAATATGAASSPPAVTCSNQLFSYAPTADDAAGYVATIKKRGRLVVGVSADTRLFGARNPVDNTIEGFDIDILKQIAAAIFGRPDGHIEYRVITAAQRIPAVQGDVDNGTSVAAAPPVDVVARTMSITCGRWQDVAFSTEYFRAGQSVLVAKGTARNGMSELKGKRVCAPAGTSSLTKLKESFPEVVAVSEARHTDCLADFQEGTVDAITGDNTVLAGFVAQDPYAQVAVDQKPFTVESYGLAVNKSHPDFVRFLNGVLDKLRTNGTWASIYRTWLVPSMSKTVPPPPPPHYGR